MSFACAIYARPTWAGIFLGLATGCRITSPAMLGPIALIIFAFGGSNCMRALIRFVVLSIISAVVFFFPVWLRYGASFFTFYENHAWPDGLTILNRGTLELWGPLGR